MAVWWRSEVLIAENGVVLNWLADEGAEVA